MPTEKYVVVCRIPAPLVKVIFQMNLGVQHSATANLPACSTLALSLA